jgi:hypothetical protein
MNPGDARHERVLFASKALAETAPTEFFPIYQSRHKKQNNDVTSSAGPNGGQLRSVPPSKPYWLAIKNKRVPKSQQRAH